MTDYEFITKLVNYEITDCCMPLGIYISVRFCRTKCTFCNFASGVVAKPAYLCYTDRVCADITASADLAARYGVAFDSTVDSVYVGGGTPTVLEPVLLERMFSAIGSQFR